MTSVLVQDIKRAKKRCVTMGQFHVWNPDYDKHPLAPTIDNYTVCIDVELQEREPDYLVVLTWIHHMASRINQFCEDNRIVGNDASEYWLERFLWRSDCICDWQHLN